MNNKTDVEQFKKEMEELKPGDGVRVDEDTTYEYGADLHTDGVRVEDPAYGKSVSIRCFEFKMNPDKDARKLLSWDKQSLFNAHAKQISTVLWSDGLRPLDMSPRVVINKKKLMYQIFVPCEANSSNLFVEKPKSLSNYLNGTPKH